VRQALGPEAGAHIRTVRGRGYLFDPPPTAAAPDPASSAARPVTHATVPAPASSTGTRWRPLGAPLVAFAVLVAAAAAATYRIAGDQVNDAVVSDAGALPAGYSPDTDADLLYLRGRHQQQQTTEDGIRSAIDLYTRAIAADPGHARAHAALADAYRGLAIIGYEPSLEAFPHARRAALRALDLDDQLVEAHVALGWVLFFHDWKWTEAEASLTRAIELDPNHADAHRAYAHLYRFSDGTTRRSSRSAARASRTRERC
jgi:tetratricopeptide (TPR) repeat protein